MLDARAIPKVEIDPKSTPKSPREKAPDRRRSERRGTAIQIIRFTNERRRGGDRRRRQRRGFERHPLDIEVTVRLGDQAVNLECVDLSVLGLSLAPAPALPVGGVVRLSFHLPDDLADFPVETWAQVTSERSQARQLGLKFVGLRACDARRIGRHLARKNSGGGPRSGPEASPYRF